MSPKEINESLKNLFSDNGFEISGFKVKSESPLVVNINHAEDKTIIRFGTNSPRAEIKRFITFHAYIEEVTFGPEGGSIRLRNFPDLHFKYENSLLDLFTQDFCHSVDLQSEINEKYCDKKHKEIANMCLQYAEEWSKISMQSDIDFSSADFLQRRSLMNQCYDFVKDNVEKDIKEKYSSVFITFILIYVILPAIISWIVHRVLDKLFTE